MFLCSLRTPAKVWVGSDSNLPTLKEPDLSLYIFQCFAIRSIKYWWQDLTKSDGTLNGTANYVRHCTNMHFLFQIEIGKYSLNNEFCIQVSFPQGI